ncbi:uncharacterized protein LOC129895139 [Solanum dulcamara]|uniref:uncharacterized protein LOC129895139 n=1 Tax=Solanum dulcamara TaxID=45834 RepID=UPI0024856BAB|nr:uncharacterized protein LOC129895139 [Solanum dulcamara]
MPGLIVETEKKLQEDDWIVEEDDDMDNSDEGDDADDSDDDDDKEDDAQEPTREQLAEIRMKLANIEREIADIRMMMEDNFKQILLTLEALPNKVSEILAHHLAGLSVSHEPGPTPAPTTVDSVASKPDSASSSPAHAPDVDAPPATTSCTPDRAPAFLIPAVVVPIPPIEAGDTHMPDAAA